MSRHGGRRPDLKETMRSIADTVRDLPSAVKVGGPLTTLVLGGMLARSCAHDKIAKVTPPPRAIALEPLTHNGTILDRVYTDHVNPTFFFKVRSGDTIRSINRKLRETPQFSYLPENNPGSITWFNMDNADLQSFIRHHGRSKGLIPIPRPLEGRVISDQDFAGYAEKAILSLCEHPVYGDKLTSFLSADRDNKDQLVSLIVATAKKESGIQGKIGSIAEFRYERSIGAASYGPCQVLDAGPGATARDNLGFTIPQILHPQNDIELKLGFMFEKLQATGGALTDFFPVTEGKMLTFSSFYNGKGFRSGYPKDVWDNYRAVLTTVTGAAPASPPLEDQFADLVELKKKNGRIDQNTTTSYVVMNCRSNEMLCAYNGSQPMQLASVIKLYVLTAYLHEVQAHRQKLTPQIKNHIVKMIRRSNNTSTNILIRKLGGASRVEELLKREYPGFSGSLRFVQEIPANEREYSNMASPQDVAKLLTAVAQGRVPLAGFFKKVLFLPKKNRRVVGSSHFLREEKRKNTFRFGNKTGSTAQCINDSGIYVYGDQTFVMVCFTNNDRYPSGDMTPIKTEGEFFSGFFTDAAVMTGTIPPDIYRAKAATSSQD